MRAILTAVVGVLLFLGASPVAHAIGTLEPEDTTRKSDLVVVSHDVAVTINNGFARTEVSHVFLNRGPRDLEARYAFPVPKSASLSELTIVSGEDRHEGEVLAREKAKQLYEEERDQGKDAALGTKDGHQRYEFAVSPVRAGLETKIRFVYYQPLDIDTGVGRYAYPLEDGGTDEGAGFWTKSAPTAGRLSFRLELKSAHPVADVRMPGHEAEAKVEKLDEGHYRVSLEQASAKLNRDLIFYYRLKDGLPGRVELIPYRADENGPGTFMLVVTPGLDLKPITRGADYTFVLDVSGSMSGKIHTLARGVSRAVGELGGEDRFRIIAFSTHARMVTPGFLAATPENVREGIRLSKGLVAEGSTNLYDGVTLGLSDLDADRAQSVILVTDAETNQGILAPREFHHLMGTADVRVFGFLLGNNANWPLMRVICDASGGFWAQVSNADDILGQIVLAKSKITHECLHDAELRVEGVKVHDTTDPALGKVFRGQQLVFFGKYEGGGQARVTLTARRTGEDRTYETTFDFPEIDTENPEIERLWALHMVEAIEALRMLEVVPEVEGKHAVRDLGVEYQIVTDETAMVVMSDASFAERGIERKNRDRVARENHARQARRQQPARDRRVDDQKPMFGKRKAPGIGGGALDPFTAGLGLALVGVAAAARGWRKRKNRR